jgi:hypothetical protein
MGKDDLPAQHSRTRDLPDQGFVLAEDESLSTASFRLEITTTPTMTKYGADIRGIGGDRQGQKAVA